MLPLPPVRESLPRRPLLAGRPALFALAAFALGIAVARSLSPVNNTLDLRSVSQFWFAILIGFFLLLVLLQSFALARRSKSLTLVLLFCSISSIGFLSSALSDAEYIQSPIARLAQLRPQDVIVTGKITAPLVQTTNARITVCTVDSLRLDVVSHPYSGKILLMLLNDSIPLSQTLSEGDRVELFGHLEPFADVGNPHEYPIDAHARDAYHSDASMTIAKSYAYRILDSDRSTSGWQWLQEEAGRVREWSHDELAIAIRDSTTLSFVDAMVLGERSEISEDMRTDFTRSGVAHVLAASGFHVAVIAACIAGLLRLLGFRKRALRYALSMLAVALYALIVGFHPSVLRAFLMIELYFLARLLEVRPDALNIACGTALTMLLVHPFDLFDVGFQLTYAAVIGVAIFYPEMRRLIGLVDAPEQTRAFRAADALAVSVAATIATLPVTVLHFHRLSSVGALANVPGFLIAGVITTIGFFTIPLTAIYAPLGKVYGDALQFFTTVLLTLTHSAAHLPKASIPASMKTGFAVLITAFFAFYIVRAESMRHVPIRIFAASIGIFVLLSIAPIRASIIEGKENLSLLFFDVGQGDCVLMRTPTGKTYLVDFGGISGSNVTRAEKVVTPFLQAEGIAGIDAAFITHMHRDHFGGAPYVLANEPIDRLYWTGEHVNDKLARELDSVMRVTNTKATRVSAGDLFHLEPGLSLYVLHPPKMLVDMRGPSFGDNLNNGSLAIKITYGSTSYLLLGDIEGIDEKVMIRRYGDLLRCDALKVAHHGSRTSSTPGFIAEARPHFAVISVGEGNRYGHPAAITLHRWAASGARVCRTDRDGAVLLQSDGERVWQSNWRE